MLCGELQDWLTNSSKKNKSDIYLNWKLAKLNKNSLMERILLVIVLPFILDKYTKFWVNPTFVNTRKLKLERKYEEYLKPVRYLKHLKNMLYSTCARFLRFCKKICSNIIDLINKTTKGQNSAQQRWNFYGHDDVQRDKNVG